MKYRSFLGALMALALALFTNTASAAIVQSIDFSSPVTTSATQAPGTWYTDRYAPQGFVAPSGELLQTISSADSATNRPGAFSGTFYNTQGRKLDLAPGVTTLSIDLYVDPSWASTGDRMAGLWGTMFDAGNAVSFYPILEVASNGVNTFLQGWNGGGWNNYGSVGSGWHDLSFALSGGLVNYFLDGNLLGSVGANGSTYIGNAILQGYNTFGQGETGAYDIRWDNLQACDGREGCPSQVPEPGTLALLGGALFGLGFMKRKKQLNLIAG